MSTPVHYDVEAAIANFLAMSKKREAVVLARPDVGERVKVQLRNREVAVALLRMVLQEQNRGTDNGDVLGGFVDIVAEFLINTVQIYRDEDQADVAVSILNQIGQVTLSGLAAGVARLPAAEITKMVGGHA